MSSTPPSKGRLSARSSPLLTALAAHQTTLEAQINALKEARAALEQRGSVADVRPSLLDAACNASAPGSPLFIALRTAVAGSGGGGGVEDVRVEEVMGVVPVQTVLVAASGEGFLVLAYHLPWTYLLLLLHGL